MKKSPSIDRRLNAENRDAGGGNLLRRSHGSVIPRVMKMGHIINRSMYRLYHLVSYS